MENRGLLFIPDISGFTQFIHQTEIEHSRLIIQELLETLIDSNNLQLQVSEIEGDAILFYRFGNPPSLEEIFKQVNTMYCNFHRHLKRYSQRKICHCAACDKANTLTLKIITHEGEFSTYTVKDFSKLIGKDVINAHLLLKNDILQHEYWLVTENLLRQDGPPLPEPLQWERGLKKTENSDIHYQYCQLAPLKATLVQEDTKQYGIKGKRSNVLSIQREIEEEIQFLFHIVADVANRTHWLQGVKAIDHISSHINQVGTSHHCVLGKNIEVMYTSDFTSDDFSVMLEETDEKKLGGCRFELKKINEERCLMTITYFLKKNYFLELMFTLFMKRKVRKEIEQSLDKLQVYAKSPEAKNGVCF